MQSAKPPESPRPPVPASRSFMRSRRRIRCRSRYRRTRTRYSGWLQRSAARNCSNSQRPLRARGITVHCEVVWDFPAGARDRAPRYRHETGPRRRRVTSSYARRALVSRELRLGVDPRVSVSGLVRQTRTPRKERRHPDGDRSCTCTRETVRTRRPVVAMPQRPWRISSADASH